MGALSTENIQFINDYLEFSEIVHADIRMEMTDHVASEIEKQLQANATLTFYDAFKYYMLAEKTNLLQQNRKYLEVSLLKSIKLVGKTCLTFNTLIVFSILTLITHIVLSHYAVIQLKQLFIIPLLLMVPMALAYYIAIRVLKVHRFSGIERLGFLFSLVIQLFHFISILFNYTIKDSNLNYVTLAFAACLTLLYVFIKVSVTVISKYKQHYQII